MRRKDGKKPTTTGHARTDTRRSSKRSPNERTAIHKTSGLRPPHQGNQRGRTTDTSTKHRQKGGKHRRTKHKKSDRKGEKGVDNQKRPCGGRERRRAGDHAPGKWNRSLGNRHTAKQAKRNKNTQERTPETKHRPEDKKANNVKQKRRRIAQSWAKSDKSTHKTGPAQNNTNQARDSPQLDLQDTSARSKARRCRSENDNQLRAPARC